MIVAVPGSPPVVVGSGSIDHIADLGIVTGPGPAVLVVDSVVADTTFCERAVIAASARRDVRVHVVPAHEPTAASVDAAADAVRAARAALVVGLGGGTALDTAKQAAAVAGGAPGIEHYALGAHPLPGGPPVVAVPTTAGTGAEVTRTCVVTSSAGHKVWTWGDELRPRLVVLDPAATATMPPHVTAATGLDAFVHAVEAVTGRRTNSLVAAPALHAIRLVLDHLPVAVADGGDLGARQAMQEAALLAGLAIDGGGTGIAHSIGHALGTQAHVPHGVAVAIALAAALPWNVAGQPDAFDSIARSVGRPTGELADTYLDLLVAVRFPVVVGRVGPLDVTAEALADTMVAEENLPMYRNNCRLADDDERLGLATSTLRLWEQLLDAA